MQRTRYKLCGVIGRRPDRTLVERMFRYLGARDADLERCVAATGAAVLAGGSAESPAVARGPDGSLTLLAGAVYNGRELADRHGLEAARFDGPAMPATVAAMLDRFGPEQTLNELNGVFALVHVDAGGRVVAANDRYGFGPLMYHIRDVGDGQEIVLATQGGAISTSVGPLAPDHTAWGLFFYAANMLGDRTLIESIRFLDAGEYLTWQGGQVRKDRYFDPLAIPTADGDGPGIDRVAEAMNASVARRVEAAGVGTVMISGGLDSRWILASLLEQGHRPDLWHVAFNRAVDRAETACVDRLLDRVGMSAERHAARSFHDHSAGALDVFRVVDGAYPTFGLICTQLFRLLTPGDAGVWDGVALGTIAGGHNIFHARPAECLPRFLRFRRWRRPLLMRVFNRDLAEHIDASAAAAADELVARMPDEPGGWAKFVVSNRQRRRIGPNCYQLYAEKRLCFGPGTDSQLLDLLLTIPAKRLADRGLYVELFARRYPHLLDVPATSSHVRVDLSAGGRGVVKPGVADRVNALVNRRGLGWLARGAARWLRGDPGGRVPGMLRLLDACPPDGETFNLPWVERGLRALRRGGRGSLRWIDPIEMVFYVQLWRALLVEDRYEELRGDVFPERGSMSNDE